MLKHLYMEYLPYIIIVLHFSWILLPKPHQQLQENVHIYLDYKCVNLILSIHKVKGYKTLHI